MGKLNKAPQEDLREGDQQCLGRGVAYFHKHKDLVRVAMIQYCFCSTGLAFMWFLIESKIAYITVNLKILTYCSTPLMHTLH